jgi:hypothetical protein
VRIHARDNCRFRCIFRVNQSGIWLDSQIA